MKLVLKLTMDNEAFFPENGPEVARILRRLANEYADRALFPRETATLRDYNGNAVGTVRVTR